MRHTSSSPKPPITAAVVGVNGPFSKDTTIGFRQGTKDASLRITEYTLFPPDADLAPIANVVASGRPDVVAVGGHDVLLVDVVNALKAAKFTPKALIEHYGITDPSFAKALRQDAEGVLGISVWLPSAPYEDPISAPRPSTPRTTRRRRHRPGLHHRRVQRCGRGVPARSAELGKPPGLSQEDRVKLNDFVARTDIVTFYGPINFADSGDNFHNNTGLTPVLVQIQDGSVTAVAPKEAASADMSYPLTPRPKR